MSGSPYRENEPAPLSVVVTTGEDLPGHRVAQVLGVVHGISSRTGSSAREARRTALASLIEEARQLRAEAVIALRYDSNDQDVVAYGTAVRLVRLP